MSGFGYWTVTGSCDPAHNQWCQESHFDIVGTNTTIQCLCSHCFQHGQSFPATELCWFSLPCIWAFCCSGSKDVWGSLCTVWLLHWRKLLASFFLSLYRWGCITGLVPCLNEFVVLSLGTILTPLLPALEKLQLMFDVSGCCGKKNTFYTHKHSVQISHFGSPVPLCHAPGFFRGRVMPVT